MMLDILKNAFGGFLLRPPLRTPEEAAVNDLRQAMR